jgi:hypothetical protein
MERVHLDSSEVDLIRAIFEFERSLSPVQKGWSVMKKAFFFIKVYFREHKLEGEELFDCYVQIIALWPR